MDAGGGANADEDFVSLPVEQRLQHKSWKARLSAYTELCSVFSKTADEHDAAFQQFTGQDVREWLRDSNAVSQEKAVDAASTMVQYAGRQLARSIRPEVLPSVIEKCLGSTRAGTKNKAIELCLQLVEAEEDQADGVISDLAPGLDAKQPKVVAGVVSVLREMVKLFGPKTVNVKPILKLLPKIFAHADKNVRAEGSMLAIALHGYLGPALDPHLSDLKPVQVKELGDAFTAADAKGEGFGGLKPTRFTRSQQREMAIQQAQPESNDDAATDAPGDDTPETAEPEAPPDPFDFAEPVNVLSKLPEDFDTNLSSTKWKERKELALEPLLSLVKAPRLQPGNYDDLLRSLAGRMTDANVVCVALAANCMEAIALGLRSDFGRYKSIVVTPMLARTKEKKASVLDAIGAALDATFASTSIGDVTEEVTTFAKDKNPSVKEQTIRWYTRCLKTTSSPPTKSDTDSIFDVLKKALEDSNEPVRAAAADCLGTLMKVVGERALAGRVDELDDLRKAKVKEAFQSAVIKLKAGAAAKPAQTANVTAARPSAAPAAPRPKPAMSAQPSFAADKENAPLADAPPSPRPPPAPKGPPARLMAKKPVPAAAPVKKAVSAAVTTKPSVSSKASEPLKYKYTQEDAENQAETGGLPEAIIAQLQDSNWKQRLEGVTGLYAWLEGGEIDAVESELVVRYMAKKPGWKESNFQVYSKMYGIFQLLAEKSPTFGKSSAALAIPPLSEKLGDIKLKKPAGDALTIFAEKTSLQFVLSQAYEPMLKQKAPKAQADAISWVEQAVRDFGIVGLSVREMIDYLIAGLKSTNPAVRTSATKALVTLRLYVGSEIVQFLGDLNPQLLSTIESEFAKVSNESAPEPTRVGADTIVAIASSASATGTAKGKANTEDPMDQLFPRVDFDKLVPSSTISACGDANWKMRKEALESIQSILEANKRLKPSPLSDLAGPLKQRLSDSNKIVQQLALDVIARIATGMGSPFERHARMFAAPTAQILSDPKAPVRAAAVATLSAMADASGLDTLIPALEKPLDSGNPILRKELLGWLEDRFKDDNVVASADLAPIATSILSCLEDRTAEVRKSATALLPGLIARAGYDVIMDLVSKLKPASRNTVLPFIEAARASASVPLAQSAAPKITPKPAPATASSSSDSTAIAGVPRAVVPATAPRVAVRPGTTGALKTLRTVPSSSSLPSMEEPSRLAAPKPKPSLKSLSGSSSRAPSAASSSSQSALREAPFTDADPKPKTVRASKETGSLRWLVEGIPRPDQVEALLQQMTPHTSPELIALLFSKDHNAERDFVAGLTSLDECAKDPETAAQMFDLTTDEIRARLVANVDVVFKYVTLRIGLSSTVITVKCLDLIDHMIPVLDESGYKLSDYETSALLVSLIAKVGDTKETIRNRVRTIFKDICKVYPFSKVFNAILEHGLVSKNARVRSESADELGRLFAQHGANAFPVSKALPLVAKLISDRDAGVRTAALHSIGAVYTHLGAEATWKLVGPIPAKEKAMLEERLKRTEGGGNSASGSAASSPVRAGTAAVRPAATPGREPKSAAPSPRTSAVSSTLSATPAKAVPQRSAIPSRLARPPSAVGSPAKVGIPRAISRPSISATGSRVPSTTSSIASSKAEDVEDVGGSDTAGLIEAVRVSSDVNECCDLLKDVQALIARSPDALESFADATIDAVLAQMPAGFDSLTKTTPQSQLRLCKHLMQSLSAFFDHRTLGQAVSPAVLKDLLADLTARLLDTAERPESEAISSLSKVLNMVLIRIFHHANANSVFSGLFSVLVEASLDLRELTGQELDERAKYAELVMKCLWKVSKTAKESLEQGQLNVSILLRDMNNFLNKIPPAEWRRRASDNVPLADMPLRTAKTILQQIVNVFASEVYDHLDEIPSAETSFVYQYLLRLESAASASNGDPAGPNDRPSSSLSAKSSSTALARQCSQTSTHSGDKESASVEGFAEKPSSSSHAETVKRRESVAGGADVEMNQALKQIFALYEYRKQHPEASSRVAQWMAGTGNYFQTYLQRALDNLAQADEGRSSSGSVGGSAAAIRQKPAVGSSTTPATAQRQSVSGPPGAVPASGDRLSQLHGVFGFNRPAS
ncbi:hypothetical protein OIV83_001912 [Microbotryomycetes sp. JL201]|nr:hypothetical protein OIV83_001912 [Microbotryomycetes sp. JL201]